MNMHELVCEGVYGCDLCGVSETRMVCHWRACESMLVRMGHMYGMCRVCENVIMCDKEKQNKNKKMRAFVA